MPEQTWESGIAKSWKKLPPSDVFRSLLPLPRLCLSEDCQLQNHPAGQELDPGKAGAAPCAPWISPAPAVDRHNLVFQGGIGHRLRCSSFAEERVDGGIGG
jgi:hypothetical protein